MIQVLELIFKIVITIAVGLVIWVLWPTLNALVSALNGIAHLFTH